MKCVVVQLSKIESEFLEIEKHKEKNTINM